jgi:ADP-ribose pyrophosphatase YjhB (NUDIX family)
MTIPTPNGARTCDNTSVGVVVTDGCGRYLLFDRNTFPPGAAPPAGHVDDHGSYAEAGYAEVSKETGLTVTALEHVGGGWRGNRCRRAPGPQGTGHMWRIFLARATGELAPSPRETRNARWLDQPAIQALAARTVAYASGLVTTREWAADPGLEPVWVRWLADIGIIPRPAGHEDAIELLTQARPAASQGGQR